MREEKKNVPLRGDFLRVVRSYEHRCQEDSDGWLPSAGVKASETLDGLGTVLSYLDA